MRETVVLRPGHPDDAPMVAALATQVFLDTYATHGIRPDMAREVFEEYSGPAFAARLAEARRRFVLAVTGEAIVGFAELLLPPVTSPIPSVSGSELVRLYVQPRAQRSGTGTRLLTEAERMCSTASLWLTAWDRNTGALAFYRRSGYFEAGDTIYKFQGNSYTNRVLVKRLNAH